MKTYISFGQVHVHSVNGRTFDKDCIAVIEAESVSAGRDKAFELFGPKFCFSYTEPPDMKYFPRGFIEVEPAD